MFGELIKPCNVCGVNLAKHFNNTCNECYQMLEEVAELQHQEALEYSYEEDLEFSWKEGGQPPKPSTDLSFDDQVIPF